MQTAPLRDVLMSDAPPLASRVDVERVRVKLELARVRSSGPVREIPSGRVFDEPPPGAAGDDEVPSADKAKEDDGKMVVAAPDGDAARAGERETAGAQTPEEDDREAAAAAPSESAEDAGSPPPSHSSPKSVDNYANANEESQAHAKAEPAAAEALLAVAESETSTAPGTDDESLAGPASALLALTKQSVNGVAAPPAEGVVATVTTEQAAANARSAPEETRSLNEYLISELELFSRVIRGEVAPISAGQCSRIVHATTLQLYYDHRRALRDFDADSQRSHVSGTDKDVAFADWIMGSPTDATSSALVTDNPFKRGASDSNATEWVSVLKRTIETQGNGSGQADEVAKIDTMHTRGLNGLVVASADRDQHRRKLRAFMIDDSRKQKRASLHIVIASIRELAAWDAELSADDRVQVYPYWGEKEDREQVLRLVHAEYFVRQSARPHVVLTSYDVFAENAQSLGTVQWQTTVVDVPESTSYQEQLNPVWTQLLSLRTRHRLLVPHQAFQIDTRRTLQFLLPALFSSRRKLLAWNCAAFDVDMIHRMCDVIESFALIGEGSAVRSFIAASTQYSIAKSDQELTALNLLDKSELARRPVSDYIKKSNGLKIRELFASSKSKSGASSSAKLKARRLSHDLTSQPITQTVNSLPQQTYDNSDLALGSRKRLGRCGKCTGCLAGDCMTCGHCQDMKKYGGPGLRKQSCKNRKCINPRRWGMAVRKRRRSKAKKVVPENDEGGEDTSEKYESDFDDHDDHDDGATSYYSQDSDHESTFDTNASHDTGFSDSDSHEIPRTPERDTSEQLHDTDADLKESRTRVMRCGKCSGCTASDCRECGHCLDKKKYGGPGLRKQSCKNRKCVAPKVVLLNQAKDEELGDEKNAPVAHDYFEAPEVLNGAALYRMNVHMGKRTEMISVVQECEVFIDHQLVFTCGFCHARFSAKKLLEMHERVEHAAFGADDRRDPLEIEASRLLLHPILQHCFINAQHRDRKILSQSCPRAYAKLQGAAGLQYFVMEPCVVLGRLSSRWLELYRKLDVRSAEGLAGGSVDCHIGDDASVREEHAVIAWSFSAKQFTIECLSADAPISVNGKEVRFDEEPLALQSPSRVQVGSVSFFFLLPKSVDGAKTSADDGAESPLVRRSELQAWLHATMRKRRASAAGDSVEQSEEDCEISRIKKRCQERLAGGGGGGGDA